MASLFKDSKHVIDNILVLQLFLKLHEPPNMTRVFFSPHSE
jgi:hypothetical protein